MLHECLDAQSESNCGTHKGAGELVKKSLPRRIRVLDLARLDDPAMGLQVKGGVRAEPVRLELQVSIRTLSKCPFPRRQLRNRVGNVVLRIHLVKVHVVNVNHLWRGPTKRRLVPLGQCIEKGRVRDVWRNLRDITHRRRDGGDSLALEMRLRVLSQSSAFSERILLRCTLFVFRAARRWAKLALSSIVP